MNEGLIRRKLEAERDAYDKPLGVYKVFSFLMNVVNDQNTVKNIMLNEGYSRTEISRTQSKYFRYKSKSKA